MNAGIASCAALDRVCARRHPLVHFEGYSEACVWWDTMHNLSLPYCFEHDSRGTCACFNRDACDAIDRASLKIDRCFQASVCLHMVVTSARSLQV